MVSDILDCIARIERYTARLEFEDFLEENKTIDAVLRNLAIMGEATSHIPEEILTRNPNLP